MEATKTHELCQEQKELLARLQTVATKADYDAILSRIEEIHKLLGGAI